MFAPSHASSIPAFTISPDQNMLRETVPDKEQRDGPGRLGVPDGIVLERQVVEVPVHVLHHPVLSEERRRSGVLGPVALAPAADPRHDGAPPTPAAELQPGSGGGGSRRGGERGRRGREHGHSRAGRAGAAWAGRRRGRED